MALDDLAHVIILTVAMYLGSYYGAKRGSAALLDAISKHGLTINLHEPRIIEREGEDAS